MNNKLVYKSKYKKKTPRDRKKKEMKFGSKFSPENGEITQIESKERKLN